MIWLSFLLMDYERFDLWREPGENANGTVTEMIRHKHTVRRPLLLGLLVYFHFETSWINAQMGDSRGGPR